MDPGSILTSEQPNIEEFANEQTWKSRIAELGGDISLLTSNENRPVRKTRTRKPSKTNGDISAAK